MTVHSQPENAPEHVPCLVESPASEAHAEKQEDRAANLMQSD
jgi:hypothetical protein